MRILSILFVLAAAVGISGCVVNGAVVAGGGGYELLGDRWVQGNGQVVHEGIGGLRRDGAFQAIRIVVHDAPVQMDDFWVTFGDGQQWHPGSRLDFGPGSETRDIPLPGGLRHIRRVDFIMNNFPGNGHAKVELWAR
jgi:hypothetical protein